MTTAWRPAEFAYMSKAELERRIERIEQAEERWRKKMVPSTRARTRRAGGPAAASPEYPPVTFRC